jgi:hypothetical protein
VSIGEEEKGPTSIVPSKYPPTPPLDGYAPGAAFRYGVVVAAVQVNVADRRTGVVPAVVVAVQKFVAPVAVHVPWLTEQVQEVTAFPPGHVALTDSLLVPVSERTQADPVNGPVEDATLAACSYINAPAFAVTLSIDAEPDGSG